MIEGKWREEGEGYKGLLVTENCSDHMSNTL